MPRKKFDLSTLPERPDLSFECELWGMGFHFIAGIDEAGRGALAGPVAAGAVVLPENQMDLYEKLHGVQDSKVMTPEDRETWSVEIKATAVAWGVGLASCTEIDQIGILPATHLAASRALAKLQCPIDHLLLDFIRLPEVDIPQTPLVKGDARALSIAAASILAKTARDALLVKMDDEFPGYYFAQNKGYATEAHRKAIADLGPCDQHRRTFSPIKEYYSLFPPVAGEDM